MPVFYVKNPRMAPLPTAAPPDLVFTPSQTFQTMVGFGGTDRNVPQLTDPQAAQFFDPVSSIGLSVLFGGIEPDGTPSSFYSNMTKAASYGAKIIARPWSAPGAMKDNGTTTNGGHLLAGSYGAWSDTLAAFQGLIQTNASVNLYAIGIQNEPDFTASYDSMLYTTTEMVNFLKVLGPKIKALSPAPLIVLPETANWDNSEAYGTAVLADSTAAAYIDAGGAHQYSGTPALVASGKQTWQTEYSDLAAPYDGSISEGLMVAGKIHDALTLANVTLWAWWEIIQQLGSTDNEGLTGNSVDSTAIPKRFYIVGQWSKFVRPGMVRCSLLGTFSGLSVTAFLNVSTGAFAIICINATGGTLTPVIGFTGLRVSTVTPWVTDATNSLTAQPPITCSNRFMATCGANSVTTFQGTGS